MNPDPRFEVGPTFLDRLAGMENRLQSLEAAGYGSLLGTDQTIKGSHDRLDALLGSGGLGDHGALGGLGDDDHTQYLNTSRHTAIGDGSPHHAAVTLAVTGDVLLGLSGQALTLDVQAANTVLRGPTTGAAAAPTFGALVAADMPAAALLWTDDLTNLYPTTAGRNVLVRAAGPTTTITLTAATGAASFAGNVTVVGGALYLTDTSSNVFRSGSSLSINTDRDSIVLNPAVNGHLFTGSTSRYIWNSAAFYPSSNNAYALGYSDPRWSNVYSVLGNYTGPITCVSLRPAADSTAALQLQNAAGTAIVNVDTTGGNVGIGTTAPGALLHLSHATAPRIYFSETSTVADNRTWDVLANSGRFWIRTLNDALDTAATALQIDRTGIVIDSVAFPNGNVGIGTTGPQSLLDVQGLAGAAGILTLATKELTVVDGDQLGRINFNAPLESTGTDAILAGAAIWAEADDTFSASVNSTELVFGTATTSLAIERMRLDSGGQLGIGTATPAHKLEVNGNVLTGEYLYINNVDTYIRRHSAAGNPIYLTTASDSITIGAASIASVQGFTFNSTEFAPPTNNSRTLGQIISGTYRWADIYSVLGNYTGQVTVSVATGTAPLAITSTTTVANLCVDRAALADTVTTDANLTGPITSVGNATSIASQTGTGTKFVVDTSPTLVTPIIGVATGTSLDLGATTLYGSRAITVDTGGVLNIDIGSAAGDDFTVDVSKLVVEGDTGNVGIGTAGPLGALHLERTSGYANIMMGESSAIRSSIGWDVTGNKLYLDTVSYSYPIYLDGSAIVLGSTSGKVGIGLTAPVGKLDVNGDVGLSEMTAPAGTANTARIFAVDNGAGKTVLKVIFGSGAAQQLAIQA